MSWKREFLQLLVSALAMAVVKAQTGKNVVLILGDDAGLEMGAYNHSDIKTPNLDALAARSVLFRRAYTSVSVGTPSRSVLLTGLPQHQNGMYGTSSGFNHFSSFDSITSLPAILGSNNIRTGIIGRNDLKPDSVYSFDFSVTHDQLHIDDIGRNITFITEQVRKFLTMNDTRNFFLYLAFRDPHRCQQSDRYGEFCEKLGDGQADNGVIPDWTPTYYDPTKITLPFFVPTTATARQDLANMYTAYSRLDQGVGLLMKELQTAGVLDNTLVVYTSDNGIPFPDSKTDLYEPGMVVPLLVSSPLHQDQWGKSTDALASTIDFVPTVLDWLGIQHPDPNLQLTGKSLLPLTADPANHTNYDRVFASHNFDEVIMDYPMRVICTPQYRLIHNMDYHEAFIMPRDVIISPTGLELINNTNTGRNVHWLKSLKQYYYRAQFELYDTQLDTYEVDNLADDPAHSAIFQALRTELLAWQNATQDPWRCLPTGISLSDGTCASMANGEPYNPV